MQHPDEARETGAPREEMLWKEGQQKAHTSKAGLVLVVSASSQLSAGDP